MSPTWCALGTTRETTLIPSRHHWPVVELALQMNNLSCTLPPSLLPPPSPPSLPPSLSPSLPSSLRGLFNTSDSGGECGVPHERRFPMPRPSLDQPWCVCVCVCHTLVQLSTSWYIVFSRYGFDYGSAHFVLMSTEHFFDPSSPQYQFLDNHLKTVDRTRTPWLIFAGHRLSCELILKMYYVTCIKV